MKRVFLGVVLCLAVAGCSPTAGSGGTQTAAERVAAPTATPTPSSTPTPEPPPDCTQVKCIALTFVDGPWPGTTEQLLDTLEQKDATATMFLLGNQAQAHPDLVRREQALGLEIANHTMTHPTLNQISGEQVRTELSQTSDLLAGITGEHPTLMRPPYAGRNASVDHISGELGMAVVVWDNSPQDWVNKTPEKITELTLAGAQPNSIVLFHDTHEWTVDAMPAVIDGLRAQGYEFVTVSELLGSTTPGQLYPQH